MINFSKRVELYSNFKKLELAKKFKELSELIDSVCAEHDIAHAQVLMEVNKPQFFSDLEHLHTLPLCHAGWISFVLSDRIIERSNDSSEWREDGKVKLAEFLDFPNIETFQHWAYLNPDLWGNQFGLHMFNYPESFAAIDYTTGNVMLKVNSKFTLSDLAAHYKKVAENCLNSVNKS